MKGFLMKSLSRIVTVLFALTVLAGCVSTKVTQATPIVSPGLPRPNQIWVYDFIADPAQIPADSPLRAELSTPSTPSTPEELETGRQLGSLIAKNLATDIRDMGFYSVQAGPGAAPQAGDGVIRGYLVSVQGGSAAQRFIIGLGAGTSELDTVVEGYAVTPQGWRPLGSGTLSSSGNKTPGMFVPAAIVIATGNPIGLIVVGGAKIYGEASGRNTLNGRAKATADTIADELKIRFRDRGWIS
jgi:hypothetical protein